MAFLTQEQVQQFKDQGYLLVEDLLDPVADLDPIIEEYKGVLDRLASELYARGEIRSTYTERPFGRRLIQIYRESGKVHAQYFDFSLPQGNVQPDTPLCNVSNDIRWSFDLRYNPIGQATGRGAFPGFVARSRSNPDQELRDPAVWAKLWYDTRDRLAAEHYNKPFNRWDGNAPVCA